MSPTDIFKKVSKCLRQKCLDSGGVEVPTFRFVQNSLPIYLTWPGFAIPCFRNTGSGGIDIFVRKDDIWIVNCVHITKYRRLDNKKIGHSKYIPDQKIGGNVTVRMSAPMCRHVPARGKVSAPVPALGCADTCRHVLTYECYLEAGMCWHVSAPRRCRHLRRRRHVPTRLGANTCRHL